MSASNRWWRDYDEECLAWWWVYVRMPRTTQTAMVAILVAAFGNEQNRYMPLCLITPPEYVVPPRGPIDLGVYLRMLGPDA